MQWLTDNWGNVASVIGVILSGWAVIVSTSARNAAREAKRAVELRTLSGALKTCADDVSSLSLHFDTSAWRISESVVGRVLRELSYITSRWGRHLDEGSSGNLALAAAQLETLRTELHKLRSKAPRETDLRNLYRSSTRVEALLVAEVGKSESHIDVIAADTKKRK